MTDFKTRHDNKQSFPVEKSGEGKLRNENGKVEIYNIHTKRREEFDDVTVKRLKNGVGLVTAEDDEGRKVSQFIKLV